MAFNVWLLRVSNGRIGSKLGTQAILLLETTGRKSGELRTVPIAYFEHGEQYIIVGSNWGQDSHALWYLNLKHNPRARLGIRGVWIETLAHEAEGEEYRELWQFVTDRYSPYLTYQENTSRRIPVMVFTPS